MRRLLVLLMLCALAAVSALAQTTFTSKKVDYTFQLPSDLWKMVQEPDELQKQAEFIYGDRLDGYLRIRRENVESGATAASLLQAEKDNKLSFLNGYVAGKEERFDGKLDGLTFSYEYTQTGKKMAGRIYALQADKLTFYVLRFTGLHNKLGIIRNQTDIIARTFEITKK
jgi:hypothetical protein